MKPSNIKAHDKMAKLGLLVAASFAALTMSAQSAAAAVMPRDEANAPDPYEKVNRVLFYANGALDFLVIRPAAITYKRVMPRFIRTGLHNAFSNMSEPTILFNDALQGHGKKAGRTLGRFAINSTLGLAGLVDVASTSGLRHHDNDFGITLARYGVKAGPYVFLPILGPATVRDGVGYLVTIGLDPFTYVRFPYSSPVFIGRTVGTGLDQRAAADKEIKAITANATDDYASIRSYFLQSRQADITGEHMDINALPDFGEPDKVKPAALPAPSAPTAPTPPSSSEPAPPTPTPSPS